MNKALSRLLCLTLVLAVSAVEAGEKPIEDEINPFLIVRDEQSALPAPPPAGTGFGKFFDDATLVLGTTYYGRARHAANGGRDAPDYQNEIHVNAIGQRADFISGYAWGVVGLDVSGQTNLGRGNGWSEILRHRHPENRDYPSASLGQAALKTRFGGENAAWETRAGWTPISIGSMGTSGGLFPHAYRGVESKFIVGDFWIGYGIADRFRNEWDNTYRRMTASWDQNRFGGTGERINYIHSLGARYRFGPDKRGFIDAGVGEGHRYRRTAQLVASTPFDLGCWGELTLTGYGIVGRNREQLGGNDRPTQYHASGSAEWKTGRWTFLTGFGHTRTRDYDEFQFRLTPWGNSDNRNFIQTWGQLDDFVWDGMNVVKTGMRYNLGDKIGLEGLSVGAAYLVSWNARNAGTDRKSSAYEFDYNVEYRVPKGRLKGLSLGVYVAHLRWANNNFSKKQNRNDIKVIASYSLTLEGFLRKR